MGEGQPDANHPLDRTGTPAEGRCHRAARESDPRRAADGVDQRSAAAGRGEGGGMNDDLAPRGRACMKSNDWLALATRRLLEILRAEDARRVTLAATEPEDEPSRMAVPITVADVADITPPPPRWISRLQKAA